MNNNPNLEIGLNDLQELLKLENINSIDAPMQYLLNEGGEVYIEHDQNHDQTHDRDAP